MKYVIIGDYRKDDCHNYLPHSWKNTVPSLIGQVQDHLFNDHGIDYDQLTVKATKQMAKSMGVSQAGASSVVVNEQGLAKVKKTFAPEIGKTLHIQELI